MNLRGAIKGEALGYEDQATRRCGSADGNQEHCCIVYNFQDQKYLPMALFESHRRLYGCNQGKNTPQVYLEQFQNTVNVVEHCGGQVGNDPGIISAIAKEKGYKNLSTLCAEKYAELKRMWKRFIGLDFCVL